jgi:threonine dehydratase
MNELDWVAEIEQAQQRIKNHIRQTDLQRSCCFADANVFLKCENLQLTGSFKLRGAMNKYLSLSSEAQQRGVVAASTGNHGKAVAFAANKFGVRCTIFAPNNADSTKLDAISRLNAAVVKAGSDCVESETAARQFAETESCTYVSPYNDSQVIAGQGTIGFELCQQLETIDLIVASVGGGGLISGIASYVKSKFPNCKIIGCSPENSNVMFQSLAAGTVLDVPSQETISDGTAGGVEADSVTFDLCKQLIDETVSVSEAEIKSALIEFIDQEGMLIEGSAAVALAGFQKHAKEIADRKSLNGLNVVIVLCGANISTQRLKQVL